MCSSNPTIAQTWFNLKQDADLKALEEKRHKDEAADKVQKFINFCKDEGADLQSITGLGDLIEKGLKQFNITPDLVKTVLDIEECYCEERKQWLNKVFPFTTKSS
jgi:hypothetical protein